MTCQHWAVSEKTKKENKQIFPTSMTKAIMIYTIAVWAESRLREKDIIQIGDEYWVKNKCIG